ncbi:hypothetical protein lerEdw1_014368 [Lerista edwardsae]|nr:hypothetical protein lerEdw1_014368 [Lerista edwardsae]
MSLSRLSGAAANGLLEQDPAAGMEAGAGDTGRVLRGLELGTVLTLFYQKKSQRPERRSFQVRLQSRQIVWSRTPEKVEGDGECPGRGPGAGPEEGLHAWRLERRLQVVGREGSGA